MFKGVKKIDLYVNKYINIYKYYSNMSSSTIKECFEFIAKKWTKEMYKKEKERYNKICSHILSNETETSSICYSCKTI